MERVPPSKLREPATASRRSRVIPAEAGHLEAIRTHFFQKCRQLGDTGLYIQSRERETTAAVQFTRTTEGARISIPGANGWVRLFGPVFSGSDLRRTSREVVLRVRAQGRDEALVGGIGLLAGEPNGVFRVVRRMTKPQPVGRDWRELRVRLPEPLLQELIPQADENTGFFFIVEWAPPLEEGASNLDISGFQVVEASASDELQAPYRSASHPLCADLAELNDGLAGLDPAKLGPWLLRATELGYRLDCMDTASALADRVAPYVPGFGRKDWLRYLNIRARLQIVNGARDELRTMLFSHIDDVAGDDQLTLALSAALDPDPAYLPLVGKLPSGRVNRFYLSRLRPTPESIATAAASVRSASTETGVDAEERVQRMLFMASQLRLEDRASWISWLNRALDHYGLSPVRRLERDHSNVLSTIAFAPPAAAPSTDGSPKVSVIMSAFNTHATLTYAARSILGQTHRNLELLLCDDDSTDDTWSVALGTAASDPRVRLFRSRANQGPYNIRNALIDHATGEYITFADADDFAHPERIARQLAVFAGAGPGAQPVSVINRWIRIMPNGHVPFFYDQRATRMSVVSIMAPLPLFRDQQRFRTILAGADTDFHESLRIRHGVRANIEMREPLIFGLWSDTSLTRTSGFEATEDGYRSPARRGFAEMAARQRLFGKHVVSDADLDAVARLHGSYRRAAGVQEFFPRG